MRPGRGMEKWTRRLGGGAMLLGLPLAVGAQSAPTGLDAGRTVVARVSVVQRLGRGEAEESRLHGEQVQILGQMEDPATGQRWLHLREPGHPGGPERLVLLAGPVPSRRLVARLGESGEGAAASIRKALLPSKSARYLVRSGDHLVIEEHTPVVDARLEAVALGSVRSPGEALRVRLVPGGNVLEVMVLGPGRAVFAREARP